MSAIETVRSLIQVGVEFAVDGDCILWRNSEGRMTPEIIEGIRAEKPRVRDLLTLGQAARLAPADRVVSLPVQHVSNTSAGPLPDPIGTGRDLSSLSRYGAGWTHATGSDLTVGSGTAEPRRGNGPRLEVHRERACGIPQDKSRAARKAGGSRADRNRLATADCIAQRAVGYWMRSHNSRLSAVMQDHRSSIEHDRLSEFRDAIARAGMGSYATYHKLSGNDWHPRWAIMYPSQISDALCVSP